MSLFERRLEESLEDPQQRAAYFAADAEAKLIEAVNAARKTFKVSQSDLGERLGKSQAAVSQFFNSEDHITVARLVEYLVGLGLAADIVIKRASSEEAPVSVATDFSPRVAAPLMVDRGLMWETVKKSLPAGANFGKIAVGPREHVPSITERTTAA